MERMEIRGRCGTAIAYAKVIEEEAVAQIRRMCDYEFTEGASIRIMPDVHWGKGCTIGTTMTVRDKVVPNLVGVDIGCGMYTVDLGKGEIDLERFDAAAHFVPSGRNLWDGRQEKFDLLGLRCYRPSRIRSASHAALARSAAAITSSRLTAARTARTTSSSTPAAAISASRLPNTTRISPLTYRTARTNCSVHATNSSAATRRRGGAANCRRHSRI